MAKNLAPVNGTTIPNTATFDELCNYLETPGPLGWAACIALGQLETLVALEKLIELCESSDWRFRRSAIEALAYHPQADEAVETIRKALSDSSPYVVKITCEVIAKLKLVAAHADVLALLKSKDPGIRRRAVETISVIWQIDDFDKVHNLFLSDKSEEVRKQAAWALRAHVTGDNWAKLFDEWWQDSVIRHRKWACELALMFGAHQVEQQLIKLSCDVDGHVRKAALKALDIHPSPR